MGSRSDYLEGKQADEVLGGTAFSAPGTVYAALFTDAPVDAGSGGTELTIGVDGYARVAITNNGTNFPALSGGLKQNGTAITFPQATASWGTIVAWGLYDAATSGNLLYWGLLVSSQFLFTALSSDTFTAVGHNFSAHDTVYLEAIQGVALPTGVSAETLYYVESISGDTFVLAATSGGSAINITATGGGWIEKTAFITVGASDIAQFAANSLYIYED